MPFSYQALRTSMGLPTALEGTQEEEPENWLRWVGSNEEVKLPASKISSTANFWNWNIPPLFDWVYPVTYFKNESWMNLT